MPDRHDVDRGQEFTKLLVAHQRRLYAFVYVLVQNRATADDLLQEVSATLWQKFAEFESGTNFAAWAMQIARYHVLNWRRRQANLPLALDDTQLAELADFAETLVSSQESRQDALAVCLEKLTASQRELIRRRYEADEPVSLIALSHRLTERAIYKSLTRIHQSLLGCIERQLAT